LSAPGGIGAGLAPIASQGFPCDPANDSTFENHVLNSTLDVPIPVTLPAVRTGTVTNQGTVHYDYAAGTADVTETSTVQGVNLLNGLVTATAVQARVHTTGSATAVDNHLTDGTTGTTFTNLQIAGTQITANPAPGTRIDLPFGIGYVVLNERTTVSPYFFEPQRLSVSAIHVHVNNLSGVQGDVNVAHAQTGLGDSAGRLSGGAYIVAAFVQPVLSTGVLGNISMPCHGTLGNEQAVDQASATLGPVGSVGAGHVTVKGTIPASGPTAITSATLAQVNLLNGLITADGITSRSTSTAGPAGAHSEGTGSRFTNLVINGNPIATEVPPNTTIALPGVGQVVLNEQFGFHDGIFGGGDAQHQTIFFVTALHLKVTVANTLGLPIGAEVYLAHADTGASA